MHFTIVAVAALATVGFGFDVDSAALPERSEIEVVFHDVLPASACNGCKNSFTDSMESGDTFVCPNGDSWSFTVGTPNVQSAQCDPAAFICVMSGACTFVRTGTLTFNDVAPGNCALYYRIDDEVEYFAGTNGMELTMDISVACKFGSPGDEDCEYRTVEFYNAKLNDNVVVMSWDVNFCCSKCPD